MLQHISLMRFIAVSMVLIFHFDSKILKSGYIGVDIFFVISGYLITNVAFERVHNGASLKQFYYKRIMRIFPVLLFVSFAVIFSLSLIEYLEIETLQMLRETMIFISNMKAEQINLDYFGDNKNNYLLHLWTISIELQFYLLFPLLMLSKKIRNNILIITIGLLIASLLSMLTLDLSYYSSLGRMFAFASGVLAFSLSSYIRKNNYVFFLSLIFLGILSFADLNVDTYPNYYNAIVVLLGTTALLFGKINNQIHYKPFIFIGIISYSIYLWHYPLFLFFNHMDIEKNILDVGLLFGTLLILSSFSYYLIEKRYMSKNYGNKTILLILLPLAFLLYVLYYKKHQTYDILIVNSFYEKVTLNPLLYYSDLATLKVSRKYPGCLDNKGELLTQCSTTRVDDQTKTALVLGNSFVHSGGLIFLDMLTAHYNVKSDFYYLFGDKIKTNKMYQTILDGKYDYLILYFPWLDADKKKLIEEYKELSKHTQIIFVKGTKYNSEIDTKQLFRFKNLFISDADNTFECIIQKPYSTDKGYAVIDSVLKELNAKSINIYDVQMDSDGNYVCSNNNIALYLDSGHINNYAGEFFAKRFIKAELGKDIFE